MNEAFTPETMPAAVALEVTAANGESFPFVIRNESSVFVGTGSSCGLSLHGQDVQDMHCMLEFSDGQLQVRDWHTGTTVVNGQTIEEEVRLEQGDELVVGGNRIRIARWLSSESFSVNPEPVVEPVVDTRLGESLIPSMAEADSPAVSDDEDISPPVEDWSNPVSPDAEFAQLEMDSFAFDPDDEFEDSPRLPDANSADPWQLEAEQLRTDLAQRDAEIAELKDQSNREVAEADDETTVRLVGRLEDLLDELQNSDQRVLELEQQLRVSDEANQAELEERQQLESWVQEIEQRVAQREAESQAEMENLRQQLSESRCQVSQAETQIREYLDSHSNNRAADDVLANQLKTKNRELEARVSELTTEVQQQRQMPTGDAGDLDSAQQRIQELEQKMLQMEVETSRERAEVAREKAELRRTQDELERQMRDHSEMSDSETRLVAMRQHLRERYENERAERESRRQRSLGGRISQLLKSVSR